MGIEGTFDETLGLATSFQDLASLPYSGLVTSTEEKKRLFEKMLSLADSVADYEALIFAGYELELEFPVIMAGFEKGLDQVTSPGEVFGNLLYPFSEHNEDHRTQALPKGVARALAISTTVEDAMYVWGELPAGKECDSALSRTLDLAKTKEDFETILKLLQDAFYDLWDARFDLRRVLAKAETFSFFTKKE